MQSIWRLLEEGGFIVCMNCGTVLFKEVLILRDKGKCPCCNEGINV